MLKLVCCRLKIYETKYISLKIVTFSSVIILSLGLWYAFDPKSRILYIQCFEPRARKYVSPRGLKLGL